MSKTSYYEGWGYSDTVKLLIKGKETDRNLFYRELKNTFPTEDIKKQGAETIEVFVYEKQIPNIKKMATVFKMKIAYKEGGKLDQIETAKIILDQLGGQRKLVMFTGAYNFVAIKNGVTFRIKNRGVNFIQIVLNGKDLYDVTFSKFFKLSLKKVSEHNDVYFDELIPLFEKNTGMYLKFEKGGLTPDDKMLNDLLFAEGGDISQGISIADANPYIAGAKAVQGIAPTSVSALDQRIASRINPDPNRPVFFKTGGKTEKPIENKLKVGDIVVEFRKKFPNDSSKSQIGGAGKIIKIVDAMAKVYYKINDYEQWLPLKDLIKSNNI